MQPISFSVRADLFRVAAAFGGHAGVTIEPSRRGVVLIGTDGADMICVEDPTGTASGRGGVFVGKAMVNMAVDLFRRDGDTVRLVGADGMARISPDLSGQAQHNYARELSDEPLARLLKSHALDDGIGLTLDAQVARRLSDAVFGLVRASGSADSTFRLSGNAEVTIADFGGYANAFAIFTNSRAVAQTRVRDPARQFRISWLPPEWIEPEPAPVQALGR